VYAQYRLDRWYSKFRVRSVPSSYAYLGCCLSNSDTAGYSTDHSTLPPHCPSTPCSNPSPSLTSASPYPPTISCWSQPPCFSISPWKHPSSCDPCPIWTLSCASLGFYHCATPQHSCSARNCFGILACLTYTSSSRCVPVCSRNGKCPRLILHHCICCCSCGLAN